MSTFKDENPITYRLIQMQKMWIQHICKKMKLIRWLVDKEEARMVKAFAATEASEHGKIESLFITFETPFTDTTTYGKELVATFITTWNSEEARAEVAHADVLPDWESEKYNEVSDKKSAETFVECISSFAKALDETTTIVVFLCPHAVSDLQAFSKWILKTSEILPENLKFMVYDLKDAPIFKYFEDTEKQITLEANLNMRGAMREIITSGDANNPVVGVNLCILNLTEASGKGDAKAIDHWGKEGVRLAKETKVLNLEATVLLAYGSAYYQQKNFKKALKLYQQAEEKSLEGIEKNDTTCQSLLMQIYHFQAATYLYTKDKEKAFEYYQKTASEAQKQQNKMLYLEASRQAAYVARKQYENEIAIHILKEAFAEGKEIAVDTSKFSSMLLICDELYTYAERYGDKTLKDEVNVYAEKVWGANWLEVSQKDAYEHVLTA